MSPGPDFAIVTRHAVLSGRGAGLAASLGIAAGLGVNSAAAIAGIGAIIASTPELYTAMRIAGALYLIYLGVRALLSLRPAERSGESHVDTGTEERAEPEEPLEKQSRMTTPFRQGFVTNLLNPKAIIFLVALMPQFLPDEPTVNQRLIIGAVTVVAAFAWFALLALVFSFFRTVLQRPRARNAVNGLTGAALILIGARIALG